MSRPATAGPMIRDDVIERAVERDRVVDVVLGHHLDDERPTRRVVERHCETTGERDRVDRGDRRGVHQGECGEHERLHHREELDDDEQPALVGAVGDEPCERAEQQDRAELERGEQPDRDAAVGQAEDEEGLGDERQPVADLRDQLSAEEQAEVADVQRAERLLGESLQPAHDAGRRGAAVSRSRTSSAASMRARSSASSSREAGREPLGAPGPARFELTPALGGDAHATHPPIGLVAHPFDEAGVRQRVDDLRDRRRRHLLLRGERAQRERAVAFDDGQRRDQCGRVPAVVLLAQQPREPEHRLPQPWRHGDRVGTGVGVRSKRRSAVRSAREPV